MFIKNYPYCAQRVFIVLLMFGQAFAQTSSDTVMRADSSVSALNNPYGLEALWVGSDSITKFVLLLLLVMSVSSWYIIVSKILLNKKNVWAGGPSR